MKRGSGVVLGAGVAAAVVVRVEAEMNEETEIPVPEDLWEKLMPALVTADDMTAGALASLAYREGFRDARRIVYREDDVKFHGPGVRFVAPGRRVVEGIWKYAMPEVCEFEEGWGVWLPGGEVMVCPGCGLDAT